MARKKEIKREAEAEIVEAVEPEPAPVKQESPLRVPVRDIFGRPMKPVVGGIGSGSAR